MHLRKTRYRCYDMEFRHTVFVRSCFLKVIMSILSLDFSYWIRLYASKVQRIYLFYKLLFLKHLYLTSCVIIFYVIWVTSHPTRLKSPREKTPFIITLLPTSWYLKEYFYWLVWKIFLAWLVINILSDRIKMRALTDYSPKSVWFLF